MKNSQISSLPCKRPINFYIAGGNYVGKGAEAMMLVARDQLRAAFPDACFWATPQHQGEIERYLRDGFQMVYRQPQPRLVKAIRLAIALGGLPAKRGVPYLSGVQLDNVYRVADVVIDVAGFASSDQTGVRNARNRWLDQVMARPPARNAIFMPQSWGPFRNARIRVYTRWLLKHALLAYAREQTSLQYLLEARCIDAAHLQYCPDIALRYTPADDADAVARCFGCSSLRQSRAPYIAITPNMRIYERMGGTADRNRYVEMLIVLMRYWLAETNCNLVLIPHEGSWKKANDAELCALLTHRLDARTRLITLSQDESARTVKSVIGSACFLLASRYHSLVAALSKRVPVAVIGWSHKYDELMEVVGLREYCVDPVRGKSSDGIKLVEEAWNRRETLSAMLNKRVPALEMQVDQLFDTVAHRIRYMLKSEVK